jgi:hypothetical protein
MPFDWPAVLAGYAAIVATGLLVMRLVELRRSRSRLDLSVQPGMAIGGLRAMLATDSIIQITAVNNGRRPIAISSLNLELSGGVHVLLTDHLPLEGSVRLPAVLEPHQSATMWLAYEPTRARLEADGRKVVAVVAHLTGGKRLRRRVRAEFMD